MCASMWCKIPAYSRQRSISITIDHLDLINQALICNVNSRRPFHDWESCFRENWLSGSLCVLLNYTRLVLCHILSIVLYFDCEGCSQPICKCWSLSSTDSDDNRRYLMHLNNVSSTLRLPQMLSEIFMMQLTHQSLSFEEAKMVEPANRIESESVSLKMTPSKTLPAVASPQSRRKTPTKKIDAGPSTPRRSERILSKTPSKKFE